MADNSNIRILISNASEGEAKKAFRSFFDVHYQKVFHWAAYFVKHDQIAEEVVSEVFIRIWKNRKQLSKVLQIDNYLFIATKRQALNLINQKNKRLTLHSEIEVAQVGGKHDTHPESQYIEQELQNIIDEVIKSLPPRCRLIFQMVRLDGMKYHHVAELLQISTKTVENQLLKATLILRKNIEQYQQYADMRQYLSKLVKLMPLLLLHFLF